MRRLVNEGARRGVAFPANIQTPAKPVTIDGQTAPARQPVLVSYAAANMDPARFGDGARFDPFAARPVHITFGQGPHRGQGAAGAEQFIADVLTVLLRELPPGVRLDGGLVCRETGGVSWAISDLPVI